MDLSGHATRINWASAQFRWAQVQRSHQRLWMLLTRLLLCRVQFNSFVDAEWRTLFIDTDLSNYSWAHIVTEAGWFLIQCHLRLWPPSCWPFPLSTEAPLDFLNLSWTSHFKISRNVTFKLLGFLLMHVWQIAEPWPILTNKGLDRSWMPLLHKQWLQFTVFPAFLKLLLS